MYVCMYARTNARTCIRPGPIIHDAGEAEAPGPGPRWAARYNEKLQSRTRTTLGPEISRQKFAVF